MKTPTRTRSLEETQQESPARRHWDTCPEVERDPQRVSGARIFRRTRLPLSTVYDHLANGLSIKEIVEQFPGVQEAQIRAVLQHDADTLMEDDGWHFPRRRGPSLPLRGNEASAR